jgi:Na+/proline symporter
LIWRRGTNVGAIAAMAVGTVATLATMVALGDIFANEPIYVGLDRRGSAEQTAGCDNVVNALSA